MAPRANWKGFLRLSLVTCPVALFPATSDSEKISFNQINRNTGHRIKYMKVDADTGEEVLSEDIMKGYAVDKDTYIEVSKDELKNLALESTRTIEIDEFVPKSDIDQRYAIRPYYLVPDGKVGHDAYAVIRETIRSMDMVAIGRLVLTSREHIIALEPLKNGLMGTLLRSLRGPGRDRILRRHPGRESHEGHARPGPSHRAAEDRRIRSEQVRRPLRIRPCRAHQPEARRHDNQATREGTSGHQRGRPHDRAQAKS
ncbi:MAG: Ku protein [Tardiphaga sp.]|nr:Ku protein [Tardiphaga sp.]